MLAFSDPRQPRTNSSGRGWPERASAVVGSHRVEFERFVGRTPWRRCENRECDVRSRWHVVCVEPKRRIELLSPVYKTGALPLSYSGLRCDMFVRQNTRSTVCAVALLQIRDDNPGVTVGLSKSCGVGAAATLSAVGASAIGASARREGLSRQFYGSVRTPAWRADRHFQSRQVTRLAIRCRNIVVKLVRAG